MYQQFGATIALVVLLIGGFHRGSGRVEKPKAYEVSVPADTSQLF